MRARDERRVGRFKDALQFVDNHGALFELAPPSAQAQVQALRDALRRIEQSGAAQESGAPEQTAAQRLAYRAVLRDKQLMPLRRVARVLERTTPGITALVPVPRPTASLQKLVDAAQQTAQSLEKYKQAIVACGFPEDFLQQLQGAIQTVQGVHGTNLSARQGRNGARGTLDAAIWAASDAVRCLDLVVRRVCDANPALGNGALGAWNAIVPAIRRGDQKVNRLVAGVTEAAVG